MFDAIRRWRRRRIIARGRLEPDLWRQTLSRLAFLRGMPPEQSGRLHDTVILFLHAKSIRGAAGLDVDLGMQLLIAVQACILICNLDVDYYRGWVEVIVYPDEFVPNVQTMDEAGVVLTVREPQAGEAWLRGPVILSWADVADCAEGVNVVIHEFAHKLDMLNGNADGFPPLHRNMSRKAWSDAFSSAYADFCARIDADQEMTIDEYAAESPGEFFAVMSETFFERPRVVRALYPQVYAQLAQFYRQEPAGWRPCESSA